MAGLTEPRDSGGGLDTAPSPWRFEPLVSVVVPTHNRIDYLREAVASVLAQTYGNWELIVVDDGSTDSTASYLRDVTDARVRGLFLDHCGIPARVRNAGIARARGDYVAFLDSDDLWLPKKLEHQVGALRAQGHCRWSYTDVALIDGAGNALPKSKGKPWQPHSGRILEPLLVHDAAIACPTVLAERELVSGAGGFDETLLLCEDYDLWLRLAVQSEVWAVAEQLSKVRLHAGNNTRGNPEVNRTWVEVYARFSKNHAGQTVRKLCNRQRGFYGTYFANEQVLRRCYGSAYRALGQALRARPLYGRSWVVLAKALVYRVLRPRH